MLLLSTIFIAKNVNSKEQMKSAGFGYPLSFIFQDFSRFETDKSFFPYYEKFDIKSLGEVKNFSIINFIASFLVFFLSVEIFVYVLEILDFKVRNKLR